MSAARRNRSKCRCVGSPTDKGGVEGYCRNGCWLRRSYERYLMVPSHCPICSRRLEPLHADRTVYVLSVGDGNGPIAGSQAFTCGPKGHIIVIGAQGLLSHTNNGEHRADAPAQRTILNSWKEIASYLGRGVRTVQRWETNLGLPVRRPKGKERSAVLALTDEMDAWLRGAPVRTPGSPPPTATSKMPANRADNDRSTTAKAPSGVR
jgi:hypothetical protein